MHSPRSTSSSSSKGGAAARGREEEYSEAAVDDEDDEDVVDDDDDEIDEVEVDDEIDEDEEVEEGVGDEDEDDYADHKATKASYVLKNGDLQYRVKRKLWTPDETRAFEEIGENYKLLKMNDVDESQVTLSNMVTKDWLEGLKRKREATKKVDETMVKITPGTDFMAKSAEAVLYWIWQRLDQKKWKNIKWYISGAEMPGEGEVKLLNWLQLPTLVRPGDSVALIGGDSDLVLEGLALDPQVTHNTFVIFPDRRKKSYCVSLWETTRSLKGMFPNMESTVDVINMRADLVALTIMNGNDYFPKLRGANFERLFSSYKETVAKFYLKPHTCFLIDHKKLTFNNEFCVAFFATLAKKASGERRLPYFTFGLFLSCDGESFPQGWTFAHWRSPAAQFSIFSLLTTF